MFETGEPPPPDVDLSIQFIATKSCVLHITVERTIEVPAGVALALNSAAFDESPMLHGGVLALQACGVLHPHAPAPQRILH